MKKYSCAVIVVFVATLLAVPLATALSPNKSFSQNENRYLAAAPNLTAQNIWSGNFMKQAEEYVTDQFPLRDNWVGFKSDFLRLLGCKEINGVYLGKEGYLIEKWAPEDFDPQQLTQNINAINAFATANPQINTYTMLVPTAGTVYANKLPSGAPMFCQQQVLTTAQNALNTGYIDLLPLFLQQAEQQLFYKTDHHWTNTGAYLAYTQYCHTLGLPVVQQPPAKVATTTFQGSLYSKVLGSHCPTDTIFLPQCPGIDQCQVQYPPGTQCDNTLYQTWALAQKDKYQVFLGGNYPWLAITTPCQNQKSLLIIKDSFANSFVPYLTPYYQTIYMVDLRYYPGGLSQFLAQHPVQDCLILCQAKTLAQDINFFKMTQ